MRTEGQMQRAALNHINNVRRMVEAPELAELPRGHRGDPWGCVIARGFHDIAKPNVTSSGTRLRMKDGPYKNRVVHFEHTAAVNTFIGEFDHGNMPELHDHKKWRKRRTAKTLVYKEPEPPPFKTTYASKVMSWRERIQMRRAKVKAEAQIRHEAALAHAAEVARITHRRKLARQHQELTLEMLAVEGYEAEVEIPERIEIGHYRSIGLGRHHMPPLAPPARERGNVGCEEEEATVVA